MNGDGKIDLFTGCFEGGLYVMEGLGGGEFAEPRPMLDQEGAWIRLGAYWDQEEDVWTKVETSTFSDKHGVSGAPIDWDNDGDLDLLLGAYRGGVFLRLNEGSATNAAYQVQSTWIEAAGEKLDAPGGSAMVITADWDVDGLWDILVGSDTGEVSWYRNVGELGSPAFAEGVLLVTEGEDSPETGEITRPGSRVQIAVGDHNGDGLPDLLLGDYMRVPQPQPELSDEEAEELADLKKELEEVRDKMSALRETARTNEEPYEENEEYIECSETYGEVRMRMNLLAPPPKAAGWVWLYERKT